MKTWIAIILVFVAVATCPDRSDHLSELKNAIHEKIRADPDGATMLLFLTMMGAGDYAEAFEQAAIRELQFQTTDYHVFSVASIQMNGQRETISIGAFGHVFFLGDLR